MERPDARQRSTDPKDAAGASDRLVAPQQKSQAAAARQPEYREIDKRAGRYTSLLTQSREAAVDRIRTELAAGTYFVSNEDIAQTLIRSNRR